MVIMENLTTGNWSDSGTSNLPTSCSFKLTEAELPLVLFVSSLANLVAVTTLVRLYRQLKSKNVMLIMILAANDLCSSVSILLNNITNTLTCDIFRYNALCKILGWIGIGSFGWSMYIISVISMERFLMVKYPFFHFSKVTKSRLCIAVAIGAFVSLFFLFLPLVGLGSPYLYYRDNRFCGFNWTAVKPGIPVHTFFVEFLAVYGMCQVVVTFYCNFFCMIHMRCRRNQVVPVQNTSSRPMQRQGNRFALLTVTVAMFNSICNVPFFVKLFVDGVNQKKHISGLEDSITSILLFCTPVINPILYLIFNKSYRQLLLKPFLRIGCRKTRVSPETNPNGQSDSNCQVQANG